jgi:thioredoxin-like negative regulator of GroEL
MTSSRYASAGLRRILALFAALLVNTAALAVGKPFDAAAFQAAQKAGQPILVTVHADWCSTCRTQDPIVDALLKEPPYSRYAVFRVDFDRQKDVLRQLGVRYQSTLIVFKGAKEVGRSTALVREEEIEAQLARAL